MFVTMDTTTAPTPTTAGTRKRKQSKPTRNLSVIPKVSFRRLVKEISAKYASDTIVWSDKAIVNLQEVVEKYMEQYFRVSNNLAKLCNRKTLNTDIIEFLDKYKNDLVVY